MLTSCLQRMCADLIMPAEWSCMCHSASYEGKVFGRSRYLRLPSGSIDLAGANKALVIISLPIVDVSQKSLRMRKQ